MLALTWQVKALEIEQAYAAARTSSTTEMRAAQDLAFKLLAHNPSLNLQSRTFFGAFQEYVSFCTTQRNLNSVVASAPPFGSLTQSFKAPTRSDKFLKMHRA